MMLQHKLSQWIDKWFPKTWRLSAFAPILYFFSFIGTLRVINGEYRPIPFENIGTLPSVYYVWCLLGLTGPISALIGYILMNRVGGKRSYIGLWIMLGANVSQFLWLLSFHVTTALDQSYLSDERVLHRYLIVGILVFQIYLIMRDIAALVVTEKIAKRIEDAKRE